MIQATTSFFSSFFILCCGYNYGCVHIVINIGDFDTVYWEIFASLNFHEFRVSFPIRENLFQEILGGVAHY